LDLYAGWNLVSIYGSYISLIGIFIFKIFDFLIKKNLDKIVKFMLYNLWNHENLTFLLYKIVSICVPILHYNYLSVEIDPILYIYSIFIWMGD